jgi:alpha-L-fucosidase 2
MRRQIITAIAQLILATLVFISADIANAQTKKVACVGDSITAPATGWCRHLGTKLGSGYMTQTFGVSATTLLSDVGQPAYVTSNQYKPSQDFAPNIVVIMLGTNDSMPRNWNAGKDHFVSDYEELIDSYTSLASKPMVVLNTVPPASDDNQFTISGMIIEEEINPLIKQIAMTKMCPVADVWAEFGGDVTKLDSFDGVHPGDAGHMGIAEAVAKAIMSPVIPGGAAGASGSAGAAGGGVNASGAGGSGQAGASAGGAGGATATAAGGASANPASAGAVATAGSGAPPAANSSTTPPRSNVGVAGVTAPTNAAGSTGSVVNPIAVAGTSAPVPSEPESGGGCRAAGNAASESGSAATLLLLLGLVIRRKKLAWN